MSSSDAPPASGTWRHLPNVHNKPMITGMYMCGSSNDATRLPESTAAQVAQSIGPTRPDTMPQQPGFHLVWGYQWPPLIAACPQPSCGAPVHRRSDVALVGARQRAALPVQRQQVVQAAAGCSIIRVRVSTAVTAGATATARGVGRRLFAARRQDAPAPAHQGRRGRRQEQAPPAVPARSRGNASTLILP